MWRAALAALLALTATPASGQRLVALDYRIDTNADYLVTLDINAVRKGGDIADALAVIDHVEPFVQPDGRPGYRRWLRMQISCSTRELRSLVVPSMTAPGASLQDSATIARQPAQVLPELSAIELAMCGQESLIKPVWSPLNSRLYPEPEQRKTSNGDVMRYPWGTPAAALESFTRLRVRQATGRAREGVEAWPQGQGKQVTQLPAVPPALIETPLAIRYFDATAGIHVIERGFIDAASVVQLGPDYYAYGVIAVARTAQSATATRHPRLDLVVEVRCGAQPVQRIVTLETATDEGVAITPLTNGAMSWRPGLYPFSQGLCTKQFDTGARVLTALPPAMAELVSAVKAAARQ
jgi:hypothetical protein